jgi:hypothetical protein
LLFLAHGPTDTCLADLPHSHPFSKCTPQFDVNKWMIGSAEVKSQGSGLAHSNVAEVLDARLRVLDASATPY